MSISFSFISLSRTDSSFLVFPHLFLTCSGNLILLLSFPTRRSSDLHARSGRHTQQVHVVGVPHDELVSSSCGTPTTWTDRKSTRLNSSHVAISYAVFCFKKKKNDNLHRIDGLEAEGQVQ